MSFQYLKNYFKPRKIPWYLFLKKIRFIFFNKKRLLYCFEGQVLLFKSLHHKLPQVFVDKWIANRTIRRFTTILVYTYIIFPGHGDQSRKSFPSIESDRDLKCMDKINHTIVFIFSFPRRCRVFCGHCKVTSGILFHASPF